MNKLDWKKDLKNLYAPSSKAPVIVDVPKMNFIMMDGAGDPNNRVFDEVTGALYSVAFALKFKLKKTKVGPDYAVMPLEGLWWTEGDTFSYDDRSNWRWTLMIAQPSHVTAKVVKETITELVEKRGAEALKQVRFESYAEGKAAQIMHIGPYADEPPTIEKLHAFIHDEGYKLRGKHHEIYLGDPRRAAPEKLKTIIRQPVAKTE